MRIVLIVFCISFISADSDPVVKEVLTDLFRVQIMSEVGELKKKFDAFEKSISKESLQTSVEQVIKRELEIKVNDFTNNFEKQKKVFYEQIKKEILDTIPNLKLVADFGQKVSHLEQSDSKKSQEITSIKEKQIELQYKINEKIEDISNKVHMNVKDDDTFKTINAAIATLDDKFQQKIANIEQKNLKNGKVIDNRINEIVDLITKSNDLMEEMKLELNSSSLDGKITVDTPISQVRNQLSDVQSCINFLRIRISAVEDYYVKELASGKLFEETSAPNFNLYQPKEIFVSTTEQSFDYYVWGPTVINLLCPVALFLIYKRIVKKIKAIATEITGYNYVYN